VVFAATGFAAAGQIRSEAQSEAPPPSPDPSKPVQNNSLTFTAAPAKPLFGLTERLAFVFGFTNVSQEQFCLYNKLFDRRYADDREFRACGSFTIVNEKSGEVWWVDCDSGIRLEAKRTPTLLLKPGQSQTITFEFGQDLQFHPKDGGRSQDYLPPGMYKATVALDFKGYPGSKVRYWAGTLTSAATSFEVADVASRKQR
jgi:hypothetical protein